MALDFLARGQAWWRVTGGQPKLILPPDYPDVSPADAIAYLGLKLPDA